MRFTLSSASYVLFHIMLVKNHILLYYYVVHLLSSIDVECLRYRTGLPFALRTGRLGNSNQACCNSQFNHDNPTLGEILTKSLLSARVAFNKNLLKELQDIRVKKNNGTGGTTTPAPEPTRAPTGHPASNTGHPAGLEIREERFKGTDDEKALRCAQMECGGTANSTETVCACNYKTGNVVSFQNDCDLKKHNCRYDTDFKVILQGVCPWQYESRRGGNEFNYNDKNYFN